LGAPGARSAASTHGPCSADTTPRGRHDRGVTVYFEQDTAGNVRRLHAGERITGTGAFTGDLGGYAYTAFGRPIAATDPGGLAAPKIDGTDYFQRIQWQGRWLYNRSGGLYNFRARFWSPQLGAFLQLDQYQFLSSGGTLWSWPGQNPFRWADPSGRSAAEAIAEGLELLEGLAPGVAANNNMAAAAGPAGGLAFLAAQGALELYWGQVQALGQDMFAQQDASANAIARAAAAARPGAGGNGKEPPDPCPDAGLPDQLIVCRGGTCTAERFAAGSGVTIDERGLLQGVSVNTGESLRAASAGIPNGQVGSTTVGEIRALGGDVIASPSPGNPAHATMGGITPAQATQLFTPTAPNPWRFP
jgi:RHS repeat-associated protein